MAKKIPVSTAHSPLTTGLGGFDFSDLGNLPAGPERLLSGEAPVAKSPTSSGRVVLRREKSGRGGKVVVVVDGFEPQWTDAAIETLGRKARQACGCGGTVNGRSLELQGDQPQRVRQFLEERGFRVAGL